MREKIGEFLIRLGKITPEQLAQALERQVIMGGRIGTNLIELGCLTESELLERLSELTRIPCVPLPDLEQIDPSVTGLLTAEQARKLQAIPFRRERNTLHVAFVTPQDLRVVDEVRFATGCVIRPYIVSEVRFYHCLERYYQVGRQLRYVSILPKAEPGVDPVAEEQGVVSEPSPEELDAALQQAKEDWVRARDRDEVFAVLLEALARVLNRGAIFLVKSGQFRGWRAVPAQREEAVAGLEFGPGELPLFEEVCRQQAGYYGPVPSGPAYQRIFQALNGGVPSAFCVYPILVNGRVVALVYGENQLAGLSEQTRAYVQRLVGKVGMALEIVILRKKILEL